MNASRMLKIMRRDIAEAKRIGAAYVQWCYGIGTGAVSVKDVTLDDLRVFAAVLVMRR